MIAIERLWQRVRNAVASARVTLLNDGGPSQRLQLRFTDAWVQDDVPRVAEYGFSSVPPAGADVVAVCLGGDPTAAIVIATQHQAYRLKALATGEVAISDDKGQRVYLSAAGIVIDSGTLPVQINAGGGLTINGNVSITGTVSANGHRIDDTHKHTGVTAGGGISGVPQ